MRRLPALALSALVALVPAACAPPAEAPAPAAPFTVGHVSVHPLAPGVWAAVRTEPEGLAQNANSLFVVGDTAVLVVDAQFTREATLETLAALRRVTRLPVGVVVNTHWHDDHVAGNQVYQDSFPAVRFLATPATRDDLVALGRPNREGQVRFGPAAVARYRRLLAMGLDIDSLPAPPPERTAIATSLAIFSRYVEESPGFREVLPDTVGGAVTTLSLGGRVVELRSLGSGHTRGDLVAWLPAERILAAGDLVAAPVPYAFASYPAAWIGALDAIEGLRPAVVVPGHGPVMEGVGYVEEVKAMLRDARARVSDAVARGTRPEDLASAVPMDDWRERLTGGDPWADLLFRRFFAAPVVQRLQEEAKGGG